MASLCKKQQCTIDKRGFRQELDSWRHKLIHCVGFESILESLIDSELVEDLKVFKDFKPAPGSDWSFKENCLFCRVRRDKVREHLIGLKKEVLDETPKPLVVKDQITIIRLEKQAEEFLTAILCRKDAPHFSDPHIPVVAREILQRMISQFAAEYTSKTNSPQDSRSDSPSRSDQSLPASLSLSGTPSIPASSLTGPAHNQNPVLSKLLMADQDSPLDLTIKKPLAEPAEQDGVLDLSIKKNRYSSSSQHGHSSSFSPNTSTIKSESPDFHVTKAKDLQSTSTLEQFMAKLCSHHQRQIVDAIGFLQMEVKAHASSNTQKASNSAAQGTACSNENPHRTTSEKPLPELKLPGESTPEAEVQELSHSVPSSCALKTIPENVVSLKTSVVAGPSLDIFSLGSENNEPLATPTANSVDEEINRSNDHAPLRMKIMTSSAAAGKKLSCVLDSPFSSHVQTLENKQGITTSTNRAEIHSARLSTFVKRHTQMNFTCQAREALKEVLDHPKDTPTKVFPVHSTIPSDSARTARKTTRTLSEHQIRDSVCREIIDPDLGHCDIVFIDKPITDCFKEKRRKMIPRRNARKSTRGHMYSDEVWELKTVRTLAGRGNCPNPMPELITLVTPKQILSKPEGVPPVDMPFAGVCTETMNRQTPTEESGESVVPGAGDVVEVAACKADVVVEMSQTDQSQNRGQSSPPSPLNVPTESRDSPVNVYAEQETIADSGMTTQSVETFDQPPHEATKENEPEPEKFIDDKTDLKVLEAEAVECVSSEEAEPQLSSDKLLNTEPVPQHDDPSSAVSQTEEGMEEDAQHHITMSTSHQELESDTQINHINLEETEMLTTQISSEEPVVKQTETETSQAVDSLIPTETKDEDSVTLTKTFDTNPKKPPPSRRKKRTKIQFSDQLRQTETVIVGYVNGKPVSASDRSLRHRAGKSPISPSKSPVKSSQNGSNDTDPNTAVDLQVENMNLEKPPPEPHTSLTVLETPPGIQQETEPVSEKPSSPASKLPLKVKRINSRKNVLKNRAPVLSDPPANQAQSTKSKRLLRSTSQKASITPALTPASNLVTSISSPEPSTLILPPAEQLPPLILPDSLPITTSPSIRTPEPSDSQQKPVSETVASIIEDKQPAEANAAETQKTEAEVREVETEQEITNVKAVEDGSENEEETLSSEESNPLNNLSPVKTEILSESEPAGSKQVPRKNINVDDVALIQKKDIQSLEDRSAGGDDSSPSISDKPTRMPLRSETSKAETSQQSETHSTPANNKKLTLRSQRSTAPSCTSPTKTSKQNNVASPIRVKPERIPKAQIRSSSASVPSCPPNKDAPLVTPKLEPPKQMTNKFIESLTSEKNQHLITNLNNKYDKMLKGWVQMDKEVQPAAKYKNKSDRQAAIWKSKRRARKSKSSDQQKYSPVQLLFMKGFNLTSICRWFLESTETKSLVIVKKVNTRLPSETQLCFHSSASSSGSSQGMFPSLQAERLKKHLKKFAIASPVKSNPKSLKLIAKALEQETNAVKGKERAEPPSNTQTPNTLLPSAKACAQKGESPRSGSKNPASARILRKYSNIREKMQVQQTTVRLKTASKMLKDKKLKTLAATKSTKSSLKPSLRGRKPSVLVNKRMKGTAAKLVRRKILSGKKATKYSMKKRAVKAQSCKASRVTSRKELPKRSSKRLGSPKTSEQNSAETSKGKVNSKKLSEADKEVEKCEVNKPTSVKIQSKEASQSSAGETKGCENTDVPQQIIDVKVSASPDQVLTRSQRKMETPVPLIASPSNASRKGTKSSHRASSKVDEPKLTRSGALKRFKESSLPRSGMKRAAKKAQDILETPAKRTRTK